MLLKPRKRIVASPRPPARKPPEPAFCAFCRARIAAPPRVPGPTDLHGSACDGCGALCFADPTGKQGGEVLMAALRLLARGDDDTAMGLREHVDYDSRVLAWNQAAHEVDLELDAHRYGVGRLWFFRRI